MAYVNTEIKTCESRWYAFFVLALSFCLGAWFKVIILIKIIKKKRFSEWLYTLPVEITSPIITLSEDELDLLGYNENPSIKRYID